MVTCTQCQTPNSLDSRFCKQCGNELPADVVRDARSDLGRTVAQGYVLFNEGKISEALQVAELGIQQDPGLGTALSLKGMCHERHDQLGEALSCYERVLEINPDSALDRLKVNQLRNMISERSAAIEMGPEEPNRKYNILIGALATAFVLGIGVLTIRLMDRSTVSPDRRVAALTQTDKSLQVPFEAPASNETKAPAVSPTPSANGPVSSESAGSQRSSSQTVDDSTAPIRVDVNRGKITPVPIVDPIPAGPIGNPAKISSHEDPIPLNPQVPSTNKDRNEGLTPSPRATQVDDPGVIEINVSRTHPVNHGGSQEADDPATKQVLSKVARSEFQLKRYDSAANAYEKLLKNGGDSASINQRLGQCYENMGKKGDAVTAYRRAAASLKSDIDAGRGSPARQKAALDSVQAAIKVLGGD